MKLVSLYTNKEEVFPRITFNEGLNVIFARINKPLQRKLDSHNLGKTFLITVIDFALLSKIKKDHPFKKGAKLFDQFVFYLQIKTNNDRYVTVRRKVAGRNTISINVSPSREDDLRSLPDELWTHSNLSFSDGVDKLNHVLNLRVIAPYSFRKGLRYFLRGQKDFLDEFRTSSFSRGKDRDWKPYLATVFGFNQDLVLEKYNVDQKIEDDGTYLKNLESEVGSKSEEYDEIRGMIEIIDDKASRLRSKIDTFSFYEIETIITEDAVVRLESQIADLNKERYKIDFELLEIEKSLEADFSFDIDEVKELFQEISIVFPEALVREYDELIAFNKRVTVDRKKRLVDLKSRLETRRRSVNLELKRLDNERKVALEIIREQETLEKYRRLQGKLLEFEKEANDLRQQLSQLDIASNIQQKIVKNERKRDEVKKLIQENVRSENPVYSSIRKTFSMCVERILDVPALLVTSQNKVGNLEFRVRTLDRRGTGRETSETEGTSYKKLLCACFDIAVLRTYSNEKSFYRFVYHDGVLEGLDNRKKVNLLEVIRETCSEYGIQYILTLIDSDLPRDEHDMRTEFDSHEIVRELHDEGREGRLFRMNAF